jgi:hypothetical protein
MTNQELTVFVGAFVHSLGLAHLECVPHGAIVVDQYGTIVYVDKEFTGVAALLQKAGLESTSVVSDGSRTGCSFSGCIKSGSVVKELKDCQSR